MIGAPSAYGLWSLVIINSAVFINFALSFAKPQSSRDWSSFGAFSAFLVGFPFQWPTLVTLTTFPILVFMYVRLAKREERDALAEFGDTYRAYMREVPALVPKGFSMSEDRLTRSPQPRAGGK